MCAPKYEERLTFYFNYDKDAITFVPYVHIPPINSSITIRSTRHRGAFRILRVHATLAILSGPELIAPPNLFRRAIFSHYPYSYRIYRVVLTSLRISVKLHLNDPLLRLVITQTGKHSRILIAMLRNLLPLRYGRYITRI